MDEKRFIGYNDEYKSGLQGSQSKYRITIISRIGEDTATFTYDDTDGSIINVSTRTSTDSHGEADGATITMVENIDCRDGIQRGFFAQYLNQYDRINDTIYVEFFHVDSASYKKVFSGLIRDIKRKISPHGGSTIEIVCAGPAYAASRIGAIPDMLAVTLINKLFKNISSLFKGSDIVKVILYYINLCFKGFGENTFQTYLNDYAKVYPNVSTSTQVPNPIYIDFKPSDDYASDQSLVASINLNSSFESILSEFDGEYAEAAKSCDLLYTAINLQGEDPWSRVKRTAGVVGREIWFEHDQNSYDTGLINISSSDTYAGSILGAAQGLESSVSNAMNPGTTFLMHYRLPNITATPSYHITADMIKEEVFSESSDNVYTAIPHLKNLYENMKLQIGEMKNTIAAFAKIGPISWGASAMKKLAAGAAVGQQNIFKALTNISAGTVGASTALAEIIKDSNMLYITANPELQRRVGVRMAPSETSSELFFPQITKLAAYRLLQNQYKARSCTVTIVGDPSIKIGRTAMVDKRVGRSSNESSNQTETYIYYITGVSNNWSAGTGGYTTNITLAYGRKANELPGEFASLMGAIVGAIFGTQKNYTTDSIASAKQMLSISENEIISDINISDLTYAIMLSLNDQQVGDINLNDAEYWQNLYNNGQKEYLYDGGIQLYNKNVTNEYDLYIKNAYLSAKHKYGLSMDTKTFLSWFKALMGYLSDSTHYTNEELAIDADDSFGICRIRESQLAFILSEYQITEAALKDIENVNSLRLNIFIGILLLAYYLSQTKDMIKAIKCYLNGSITTSFSAAITASYNEIYKIKQKIMELNFYSESYTYINRSDKVGLMRLSTKYSSDPTSLSDLYDPEESLAISYTLIKDILTKYENYAELSLPNKIRGAALAFKYDYTNLENVDINDDKEFQREVLSNYYKLMLSKYNFEDEDDDAEEAIRSNTYEEYTLPLTNYFITEKNESGRFNTLPSSSRGNGYGYTYGNPGIDLFTIYDVEGDNVYAVLAGTVVGIVSDNIFGTIIWIYHDDIERYSGYGHIVNSQVAVGQSVEAGELIAKVGRTSTPDAIRTFLHFEWSVCDPILTNNIPRYRINPELIIDFEKMSWGAISPLR